MRACQPKDLKRREWRSAWLGEVGEGGVGRERERERGRERERERALWLLLLYVFASTWACPMQIGLSQECCFFYLKSSLWSSDLPLTFLVFLATAILDSFSLFYLPNINQINRDQTQRTNIKSSKGKTTNNTQEDSHKDNS